MKQVLLLVTLTVMSLAAAAQNETIMLWPAGNIPNAISNSVEEKSTNNEWLRISGVTIPTLTAYIPAKDKATGTAVMICPGGGYSNLAAGHEGADLGEWFKARGIAAFVLKYRLPDPAAMTRQHEVPLKDAMQGMKLIRQNSVKYGIKPDQIGVMGFSAGGHLAATLSTHFDRGQYASDDARPNFAILLYPVITFIKDYQHRSSHEKLLGADDSDELMKYYSNELMVSQTTPPTFLVHAEDDTKVPIQNSFDYYLALRGFEIPAELHAYPTGGHGFSMRTEGKGSVANWPVAMEGWLKSRGLTR